MAGTFSKSSRPKRPGAYFNFQARAVEPTLDNTLGTVAVLFTHSWGPENQPVELGSFGDFLSIFGQGGTTPPVYTPGYAAVSQAFQGEGLPARGGAAKVIGIRMVGSGGAVATKALQNTAGSPVTGLTLTARYKGAFGNTLTVAVVSNASDPTNKNDLVLFANGFEVERYPHAKADLATLAANIDASSDWVTAVANVPGTSLAIVSTPAAFTGGNDGSTLVAGDWTAAMTALEPHRFSLLAPFDLTDSSIVASLLAWSQLQNSRGKRFMTVTGGPAGENIAGAITRASALNDPNFVTIGVGTYVDSRLGTLSTSQLAPRVAGILAQKGETQGISFARLAGLDVLAGAGASDSDLLKAIDGGVICISRDSHPQSPLRLDKGVTTFTNVADPARPYETYSVPKFVRTMHGLEVEITEWAEQNVIGRMPVNVATVQYLVGQVQARLAAREATGAIQPGWSVARDVDPAPQDTDDFVALAYSLRFGRSLEQVLSTVVVG